MSDLEHRVLSVQSHVVSGYVGNKSATFPLQLLGFEVDTINSVQFSNHTGYPAGVRGQVLDDTQLQQLVDGLDANHINQYSHIINGYIGSKSFLTKLGEVVKHLKSINPDLVYVCDPVMGDTGPGLYVPKELLPVYQEVILPLADVCLPNQFEAELLTNKKIESEEDAIAVMDILHSKGVSTVILSSTELGSDTHLVCLASHTRSGQKTVVKVLIPKFAAAFVGTGDLFTALSTAWLARTGGELKLALEKTLGTMQAVLARTLQHAHAAAAAGGLDKPTAAMMELKLIQSKQEIENPPTGIQAEIV
eukprot:GFUD01099485.1.p1 GENE.GFUD01099485.1~~GFUD01099485.1.p1  ORF type:complete len:306 (-),score=106.06 GFUD01099485.1:190-1107(-)